MLRISSGSTCGILLFLGNYWHNVISSELSAFHTGILPFGLGGLAQVVISGFAFIAIVLINTSIITKLAVRNTVHDDKQIERFNELFGRFLIIIFFPAVGGILVIEVFIIVITAIALFKIFRVRKVSNLWNFMLFSLASGERNFWSTFVRASEQPRNFFFHTSLALAGIILVVNIGFINYTSITQILFLGISASAAFIGYQGVRKKWKEARHMLLVCIPYVAGFLLVISYPLSMPFNSFLYTHSQNQIQQTSESVLYAVPLFIFIIIFGLLGTTLLTIKAEQNRSHLLKYSSYRYLSEIAAFASFALVFELFFLESISSGWFLHNINIEGQLLGGPPPLQEKQLILFASGAILVIGSIFMAIQTYADLKFFKNRDHPISAKKKTKLAIFLFVIFLIFSIGSSNLDSYLVKATTTNDYVSGTITVNENHSFTLPVKETRDWMRITAKTLSNDVVNASVNDEWGYKIKDFQITNKESITYLDQLDSSQEYRISFWVANDSDNDGKSEVMLDVDHDRWDNTSGLLASSTAWNFILLIPYGKRVFEL